MSDQFLGEIRPFGFNFAPRGWALCNGQLLPISQNTALYSLLGTYYGGDGKSTFGLPNLQGRAPVGQGQGPGLSQYYQGQTAGVSSVTLLSNDMPFHNHALNARAAVSQSGEPANAVIGNGSWTQGTTFGAVQQFKSGLTNPGTQMAPQAIQFTGGSQPHNNLMPYQVISWCIALAGSFPFRS